MYSIDDYNYELPQDLIAQKPAIERDRSRLLFLRRNTGDIEHRRFDELCDLLEPTDVLVVNDTEVIPGRLTGRKETGGRVEALILDYAAGRRPSPTAGEFACQCLIKSSKRPQKGARLSFGPKLKAEVVECQDDIYTVRFFFSGEFEDILYRTGQIPLPPYIRRNPEDDMESDRASYQTVYASQKGAVAAPTAGLHFSKKLIEKIKSRGIQIVALTLHVGYGTFMPVRARDIRRHEIHAETYSIPAPTAEKINRCKAGGSRIVAVGTTCVRTLEYAADENGNVVSGGGNCDLYIYPGYRFKVVDAVITNFHLPRTTLLMLVSAFAGRDNILAAYAEAVQKGYRFYSYGDAMFIS